MLTQEQNEFLTRTGPGTPMGDLFRRYWIPALLASELPENDCPPVRVKLLSERLLAWRDTQGRYALTDEFCAHRGVSLWFGRNEDNGLRCPYHGWKYDHTGQCVEVPSEPAESGYCRKIKLKSYPLIERGGILWAYMGPGGPPPEPAFEWTALPAAHCYNSKRWQECNYLQAMEGGIDSSHVSWLHSGELHTDPLHKGTKGAHYQGDRKPKFEIVESRGGLYIGARRNAEPGRATTTGASRSGSCPGTRWSRPTATTRSTPTPGCRSTTRTASPGRSPIIRHGRSARWSSTPCAVAAASTYG